MSRFRLIPKDEKFVELLSQNAETVLDSARVLMEVLEGTDDLTRKVRRLKDLEHAGDEVTHAVYSALNRSFVTPFDRDDIARLVGALDDVIDWIEEGGLRIAIYRLTPTTELARRFGRVILDQAECVQRVVPLLADLDRAQEIHKQVVELHRLENEADDLMVEALGTLYDEVTDVPSMVLAAKWRDVYTVLEEATDKCEHVGVAIDSILVKQG